MDPRVSETGAEDDADWLELGDSKLTGGSVFTIVTYSTSRVDWCLWLAQRFAGAISPVSMVAQQWRAVVDCRLRQ